MELLAIHGIVDHLNVYSQHINFHDQSQVIMKGVKRNQKYTLFTFPALTGMAPDKSPPSPVGLTVESTVVVSTKVNVDVPAREVIVVRETTSDTRIVTAVCVIVTWGGKGNGSPPLADKVMVITGGPVAVGVLPV